MSVIDVQLALEKDRDMFQNSTSSRVIVRLATAAAVGFGFVAGAALAGAQGGGSAVIRACVNSSSGTIRIVDAGEECRVPETPLDWNQQGVAGPQGEPGEDGAPGEPGEQGPAGTSGLPSLGQFTSTQIVNGAILSCESTNTTATWTRCDGLTLNGLQVTRERAVRDSICNVVTGAGSGSSLGGFPGDLTTPYFDWDGTTWVLGSPDTTLSPLLVLVCPR